MRECFLPLLVVVIVNATFCVPAYHKTCSPFCLAETPRLANSFPPQAMPAHMSDAELDLMEKKLKKGAAVDEIMKMMQRKRREKGLLGPSRATLQGQATICETVARIEEATLPIFGSISLFLAT